MQGHIISIDFLSAVHTKQLNKGIAASWFLELKSLFTPKVNICHKNTQDLTEKTHVFESQRANVTRMSRLCLSSQKKLLVYLDILMMLLNCCMVWIVQDHTKSKLELCGLQSMYLNLYENVFLKVDKIN